MATINQIKKIASERSDYNSQKCSYCGHTLIFNPKEPAKICSWCKHKNTNKTRGSFIYNMYRLMNDYKEKEGNKNGKEN